MIEEKYKILVDEKVIAEGLNLQYAIIFIKAIYEYYFNDVGLQIKIERYE